MSVSGRGSVSPPERFHSRGELIVLRATVACKYSRIVFTTGETFGGFEEKIKESLLRFEFVHILVTINVDIQHEMM